MTRYTNVALKRTYVEAGFNYREPETDEPGPSTAAPETVVEEAAVEESADKKPKRKRKRGKKNANIGAVLENGEEGAEPGDNSMKGPGEEGKTQTQGKDNNTKASKGKKKLKSKTLKGKEARLAASEHRRLQRQKEREGDTTCFACRERGHSARNCPTAIAADALDGERDQQKLGRQAVGICYRCGSRKHNLSRCPLPVDPENPLPFSSCFVCSKQGHMASSCPQNKSRGVYPNGGSCKLCQETTHLAKDCKMRSNEVISKVILVGTGTEAGADEDDFHTFRRKHAEVSKEERADEKLKKQQAVKMGAHSGVVKAFGRVAPKPQKVISF